MNHPVEQNHSSLLISAGPIVPVANFENASHASQCSELFQQAGVPSVEVTLRRSNAWESLAACLSAMPDKLIGVGTILTQDQLRKANDMGASFAISPGLDPDLVELARKLEIPYYPGIATASELMLAHKLGLSAVKFFPAEAAGGVKLLKSLTAPLPDMWFCPTGGIGLHNYQDFLAIPQVACVGSSAVVPSLEALKSDRSDLVSELKKVYSPLN